MKLIPTKFTTFLIAIILFVAFQQRVSANQEPISDTAKTTEAAKDEKSEGFKPGPFIIHHVLDAHEWHIAEFGNFHVTVPLPIILYSDKGLSIFMSSNFKAEEGGNEEVKKYNGFILKGEHITAEDGSKIYDFSITKNVLSIFVTVFLLIIVFFSVASKYKKNPGKAPSGLQNIMEVLIFFVRDDIVKPALGEKKSERYMPFLLTLFFFIFFSNLMGLIPIFPGGANVTGNIAVTMVLALFTFVITTFSAKKSYWLHIVNTPGVPWWLKIPIPLMPVVELIGVFTKPFVLMVRLFANITAGHIIILGFLALIFIFGNMNAYLGYGVSVVSVFFAIFMSLIELLVAFIQAYVFTLLSSLYFAMASEDHHEEAHH